MKNTITSGSPGIPSHKSRGLYQYGNTSSRPSLKLHILSSNSSQLVLELPRFLKFANRQSPVLFVTLQRICRFMNRYLTRGRLVRGLSCKYNIREVVQSHIDRFNFFYALDIKFLMRFLGFEMKKEKNAKKMILQKNRFFWKRIDSFFLSQKTVKIPIHRFGILWIVATLVGTNFWEVVKCCCVLPSGYVTDTWWASGRIDMGLTMDFIILGSFDAKNGVIEWVVWPWWASGRIDLGLTLDFIILGSFDAKNGVIEKSTVGPPTHCWCTRSGIVKK